MKKINFILLTLLFHCFQINAQITDDSIVKSPPPMAMPTANNKVLIDELIKVTNYKSYFENYCTKVISDFAEKNEWTNEKKKKIIESIDFKYFIYTIYNTFSFYTSEELNSIISLFSKLNPTPNFESLIITNVIIESNLRSFCQDLVEGKFVMSK